jgi:hypothetical protein
VHEQTRSCVFMHREAAAGPEGAVLDVAGNLLAGCTAFPPLSVQPHPYQRPMVSRRWRSLHLA